MLTNCNLPAYQIVKIKIVPLILQFLKYLILVKKKYILIRRNLGRNFLCRREQIVAWSRSQQYLGLHGNEGIVNQRRHFTR